MREAKFDNLINKILEGLGRLSKFTSDTLYYPDKKALRGTDIGMTQVDPGKTFPSSDSTLILKFPINKKIKKKTRRSQ